MTEKTTQPSTTRSRTRSEWAWLAFWVLLFAVAGREAYRNSFFAIQDIGNLFGWMIGASKSQISSAVAPLVFGLLGTIVLASLGKLAIEIAKNREWQAARRTILVHLVLAGMLAHFVSTFIYHTRLGIHHGSEVRVKAEQTAIAAEREFQLKLAE